MEGGGITLRTVVCMALLPAALFFHSLAAIGMALVGCSARRVHRVYRSAAQTCRRVGGVEILVDGEGHIRPDQAYVIVANHESNWDPVCLIVALRRLVVRAVAKRQFMDIPVLGAALRLTGNVRVLRNETAGDKARIQATMSQRDPEVSILFYAEGTRTRDGSLGAFKMGAFATALGYGLPILPVAVAGFRPLWQPETLHLRGGTACIEIGEPIGIEGLGWEDRHALRDRSFAAVRALRARARARLRERGIEPGGVD